MTGLSPRPELEADRTRAALVAARRMAEAAKRWRRIARSPHGGDRRVGCDGRALRASAAGSCEAEASASEAGLALSETQLQLDDTRRELDHAIAARDEALRRSMLFCGVRPGGRWLRSGHLSICARGRWDAASSRSGYQGNGLERLKRVATSRGNLTKRLSRLAFYRLSRGASRTPGASRLARRLAHLKVGRRIAARDYAYVAIVNNTSAPAIGPEVREISKSTALVPVPEAAATAEASDADRLYRAWIKRTPQVRNSSCNKRPDRHQDQHLDAGGSSPQHRDWMTRFAASPRSGTRLGSYSLRLQSPLDELPPDDDAVALSAEWHADSRIHLKACSATRVGEALRYAAEQSSGDFIIVLEPGDELPRLRPVAHGHAPAGRPFDRSSLRRRGTSSRMASVHGRSSNRNGLLSCSPPITISVVRRSSAARLWPRPAGSTRIWTQAAEWDLNLRLTRDLLSLASTRRIQRLPAVLCHRHPLSRSDRTAPGTVQSAESRQVARRHWLRSGIDADVTTQPEGTQHAAWAIANPPLVSIIIPNRNQHDLLRLCLFGVMHKTAYKRIEVVIVDNGSTDADVLSLYREVERDGVVVVPFNEPFSYSRALQ